MWVRNKFLKAVKEGENELKIILQELEGVKAGGKKGKEGANQKFNRC